MADDIQVGINIHVKSSGLSPVKSKLEGLDRSATKLKQTNTNLGSSFSSLIAKGTLYGYTAQRLIGGVSNLTDEFLKNNRAIREANTLYPDFSENTRNAITESSIRLAQKYSSSIEDIAQAYIVGGGAGIKFGESQKFVDESVRAATGNFARVESAASLGALAMNAFEYSAEDLPKIFNSLTIAVDDGIFTMDQLANVMDRVAPPAAELGITLEESAATLAILTQNGFKAQRAAVGLARMMDFLNKPTHIAAQTFERISGKSAKDFIASGGKLTEIIGMLAKETEISNLNFTEMFTTVDIRGKRALISLADDTSDVSAIMNTMATDTDTLEKRVDEALGGAQGSFRRFSTDTGEWMHAWGEGIATVLGSTWDGLTGTNDELERMSRIISRDLQDVETPLERLDDELKSIADHTKDIENSVASILADIGKLPSKVEDTSVPETLSRGVRDYAIGRGWRLEELTNIDEAMKVLLSEINFTTFQTTPTLDIKQILDQAFPDVFGSGSHDAFREAITTWIDETFSDPALADLTTRQLDDLKGLPLDEVATKLAEYVKEQAELGLQQSQWEEHMAKVAYSFAIEAGGRFALEMVLGTDDSNAIDLIARAGASFSSDAKRAYMSGFGVSYGGLGAGALQGPGSLGGGSFGSLSGITNKAVWESMGYEYDFTKGQYTKDTPRKGGRTTETKTPIEQYLESMGTTIEHYNNLNEMFPSFETSLGEMDDKTKSLAEQAAELGLSWGDLPQDIQDYIKAMDEAGDAERRKTQALETATSSLRTFGDNLNAAVSGLGYTSQIDSVTGTRIPGTDSSQLQSQLDQRNTDFFQRADDYQDTWGRWKDLKASGVDDEGKKAFWNQKGQEVLGISVSSATEFKTAYHRIRDADREARDRMGSDITALQRAEGIQEGYATEDHAYQLGGFGFDTSGLEGDALRDELMRQKTFEQGRLSQLRGRLDYALKTPDKSDERSLEIQIAQLSRVIEGLEQQITVQIDDDNPTSIGDLRAGKINLRLGRGKSVCG